LAFVNSTEELFTTPSDLTPKNLLPMAAGVSDLFLRQAHSLFTKNPTQKITTEVKMYPYSCVSLKPFIAI
jgi:hypothetical protein